ncbi:MAG: hypothetical protein E7388_00385 [Ruminococcaceae bacterium]|nr:hypothetical protein [Oscillospiraceae bacterium]
MKYFTFSVKHKWRALGIVLLAVAWVYIVIQCVNFNPVSFSKPSLNVSSEDLDAVEELGANYKDGKGMITINCEYSGKGGVHVFLNGRMKLYITNGSKNLRVSAGDLVYVKGYELEGSAKVSVSAVEGKVDGSIVGETVIVENLARKLVKIQSCT